MNASIRTTLAMVLTAAIVISMPGIAEQVTGLITFTAGTPIKASEVNANFVAVKTAVDGNQAQITALNARIAALEASLSNVTALNAYLSLQTVNGQPTVRVAAANLQIVNGMDKTDSKNGVGNLIIGYDELRPDTGTKQCSQATFAPPNLQSLKYTLYDQAGCEAANAVFAVNHKSGSHNLVVGPYHNYSSYGGAVMGTQNSIAYYYANVTGGQLNVAAGIAASITGGNNNLAYTFASVNGGENNIAEGENAVVSAGAYNLAIGKDSAVSGGIVNTARGQGSTVSGGGLRGVTGTNNWAGGSFTSNN